MTADLDLDSLRMDLDEEPTITQPAGNLAGRGGDTTIDFRDFDGTDRGIRILA